MHNILDKYELFNLTAQKEQIKSGVVSDNIIVVKDIEIVPDRQSGSLKKVQGKELRLLNNALRHFSRNNENNI